MPHKTIHALCKTVYMIVAEYVKLCRENDWVTTYEWAHN